MKKAVLQFRHHRVRVGRHFHPLSTSLSAVAFCHPCLASPSTFAGSSGLQPASKNPGYNWIVAVRAFAYSVDVDAVCVPSVVISFPVIFPRVMQRGLGFSVLFPAFFTAVFLLTLPRPFVVFSGSVRCLLLSTKGVCLPSRLPRFPSFFFCFIHTRLLPVSGRRIVVARTNRFFAFTYLTLLFLVYFFPCFLLSLFFFRLRLLSHLPFPSSFLLCRHQCWRAPSDIAYV